MNTMTLTQSAVQSSNISAEQAGEGNMMDLSQSGGAVGSSITAIQSTDITQSTITGSQVGGVNNSMLLSQVGGTMGSTIVASQTGGADNSIGISQNGCSNCSATATQTQ